MTANSTTPPLPLSEAVLVLGAIHAYAEQAKEMKEHARRVIASDYMPQGARMPILDPRDGTKLGTVTVTEPKPSASVFDHSALCDYIETLYPEAITEQVSVLAGTDDEVVDVLKAHAPHLLTQPRRVAAEWAVAEAKKVAEAGEAIPGVEVALRRGVPSLRAAAGSLDRYRELVAQGRVDPLRELPVAVVEQEGAA